MGLILIGLTAIATIGLLGFGIAAFVDSKRRKQEQRDFLTGIIRQAVYHTASLPNRSQSRRRALRFTHLPLLSLRTRRLL